MDMGFGFPPIGVFGFVLAIILIGSFFNYLKVRSNNETIRTLAQAGQPVDPELLGRLGRDRDDGPAGILLAGFITMAVAAGLYVFGQQLGVATGDPEVGPVFRAIAMLVGVIGLGLFVAGAVAVAVKKNKRAD